MEALESRALLSTSMFSYPVVSRLSTPPVASVTVGRRIPIRTAVVTAPGNVAASAVSATQVRVTWSASSGAAGYYVYRSTDGVRFSMVANVGGSATAYTDNTVKAATKYYYCLFAYNRNVSARSAIVSVTTAGATAPSAATNVAVVGSTTSSISLAWNDTASNESGYRVYRSTDGGTYSLIASLAANSKAYTDSGLASGTQYYYKIGDWNAVGETFAAPVVGSTASNTPSSDAINIYTRYGSELVLGGTSGNDSIFVSQSGTTLTIVANGYTSTAEAPANGLFIYSFGGSDTITVDASVTLRLTIAAIDGAGTSVNNADTNANVWIDSTDAFSGAGIVHKVANFYQNVSKAIGINITDPTGGSRTVRPTASLWGSGPVAGDVNQGGVGDCYYLASLAAFANTCPAKLQSMAVDLGDGTYAVQYMRGGTASYVRVDGDFYAGNYDGYAYAQPGASGDLWAMVMEKSYAYFRTGANSYSSLSGGWMGNVYSDFGMANTSLSLSTTDSSFYSKVSSALAAGKAVTLATYSRGTTLVSGHAYTLLSVTNVGGVNYYTVRNPWGVSGDALENSSGLATLTFAQMKSNFQLGTLAV
jgi:fibronectin type 3 domain-containing protein